MSRAAVSLAALLLLLLVGAGGVRAEEVRFEVARPLFGAPSVDDAYVLPLQDPADIAYARAILADDPLATARIVVAQIAAGADGVNRNLRAPGQPLWNWHVSAFTTFAEITIELCDGGPQFVENDVAGWMANTGGQICFWSYTVTRELPAAAPLPASRGPGALLGAALLLVAGALALRVRGRRAI